MKKVFFSETVGVSKSVGYLNSNREQLKFVTLVQTLIFVQISEQNKNTYSNKQINNRRVREINNKSVFKILYFIVYLFLLIGIY